MKYSCSFADIVVILIALSSISNILLNIYFGTTYTIDQSDAVHNTLSNKNYDIMTSSLLKQAVAATTEAKSPITTTPIITRDGSGLEMAACLLIQDQNDQLIEWIAYHYHILPLRHLVVAVDPTSVTSPLQILQRWNKTTTSTSNYDESEHDNNNHQTNFHMMNIQLWNDNDYIPEINQQWQRHYEQKMKNGDLKEMTEDELNRFAYQRHISRQFFFTQKCNQHFKLKKLTWVAHVDTDEYIAFNRINEEEDKMLNNSKEWKEQIEENEYLRLGLDLRRKLPQHTKQTVMDYLMETNSSWQIQRKNQSCLHMHRLLFGACMNHDNNNNLNQSNDSSLSAQAQLFHDKQVGNNNIDAFNPEHFRTLRYTYHAKWDNDDSNIGNGRTKCLVDVSTLSMDELKNGFTVHRVVKEACTEPWRKHINSILSVQHYLGTVESYMSKAEMDVRRRGNVYKKKESMACLHGPNKVLQPWLESFVQNVGKKRAKELLKHVGGVAGIGPKYVGN